MPRKRSIGSASQRSRRAQEMDEEQELEARLFGARKQRKTGSKVDDGDNDGADTGLGWMQDSEVRLHHHLRAIN